MRLYTLDPGSRLTTNISRISKKIKMNVLIEHVDTHDLDINGLDEIHTDKHSIEDHFLVSAKMLSIDVGKFENSKAAWESINHDHQLKIFKELKAKREMVKSVFPQQVKGCDYLLLP